MNDIQAKENIYNAATAAVNKQQENLSAAAAQVTQVKYTYLHNMVHTAVLSEKVRRKKDSLSKLIIWGGAGILGLILLLINIVIGIVFIAVVAGIAWLVKQQTGDTKVVNYNNRKAFFSKYAYAVPADEQLKWKHGDISYANNTTKSVDGWRCPKCTTVNADTSNFCICCGTKKP